jgi:hypothetical protein
MRLSKAELDAINTALSELLAGEGPQGVDDEREAQRIMEAARKAQEKIQGMIARRAK